MRTACMILVALLILVGVGCGLTPEEIRGIAQPIANAAAERVSEEAAKVAYERAVKAGLSEEEAVAVAKIAKLEAEKLSKRVTGKVVEKIVDEGVPAGEEKKKDKTGAALLGIIMAAIQAVSGRKVG